LYQLLTLVTTVLAVQLLPCLVALFIRSTNIDVEGLLGVAVLLP